MDRPIPDRRNDYFFLFCACIFFLLNITWSLLSNNTWDDDAIGRFQNTQIAGSEAFYFLDSWSRPLWVCSFYPAIHFFGRMGMVVQMNLLLVGAAYLLYKSSASKNALLLIPFFLFQTFVFGMARDAMTEPLVAVIVCAGLYCLRQKKFLSFALIGALLPLARPEQVLLLPFWAVVLIKNKRVGLIFLLGWGLVAWWTAFYLYSGEATAFFHELFKTGATENRYGHLPLAHYFETYVYVLGPVYFFFFLLGYLTRLARLFRDYFVLLQFTAGFLLYVVFSSFLDLGQAGGFLRNMVSLSPLAALISLDGFDYISRPGQRFLNKLKLSAYMALLLLIAAQFFSFKLWLRQTYDESENDYTILWFLLGCSLLTVLLLAFPRTRKITAILFFLLQIAFVLEYENPYSHMNPERKAINDVSLLFANTRLRERRIYCNHPWLLWASGLKKNDTAAVLPIDSNHLRNILPGELVLWEGHYGRRPYSNVGIRYFLTNPNFLPLYIVTTEENNEIGVLFVKMRWDQNYDSVYDEVIRYAPADKRVYALKSNYDKVRRLVVNKNLSTTQ